MDDRVIEDFWAYPLHWGETLSNHDWVPFFINKFMGSSFVAHAIAEDRRADIGTAVLLWSESFKQDPAGTLPDDDVELAQIARFGTDVEGWKRAKAGALYGWSVCHIDGERFGRSASRRLGHPLIAEICHDMNKRKRGRAQSREAGALAVLKTRVKAKLKSLGSSRAAENTYIIDQVASWLRDHELYCTEDNVRAGLEAVSGTPRVVGIGS